MAIRRLYSAVKVDTYIPSKLLCMVCHSEIDLTTSHYGRVNVGWISHNINGMRHEVVNNSVIAVETVREAYFPKKITGRACATCYDTLYNTTWRDKNGDLRRAFETLHDNTPNNVVMPLRDEAKPITKGLYAPHASKPRGKRSDTFYIDPRKEHSKVVLEEAQIKNEKLAGFGRAQGDTTPIVRKTGKVVVHIRNGKARCPNVACAKLVKLSTDNLTATITCPKCKTVFHWSV